MNIRRFVANDMREVLAAIRADLGADAVMLSTRKVPQGVEVIAAIDYDDSLFRPEQVAAAVSRATPAADAADAEDAEEDDEDVRPKKRARRGEDAQSRTRARRGEDEQPKTRARRNNEEQPTRRGKEEQPQANARSGEDDRQPAARKSARTLFAEASERVRRIEDERQRAAEAKTRVLDDDEGVDEDGVDELEDYERAAAQIREAALQRAALQAAAAQDAAEARRATEAAAQAQRVAAQAAGETVADEIKDLRRLLETQLASLAWNDLNREAPVRARLLREMAKFGVDASLATQIAGEIPSDLSSQEALRTLVRRFGDKLPLAQYDMADRGGTYAIVGPTGVGKTTTIAKIAARFVLRHGIEGLGLVSTDTYRIGARQQLSNFARILRAPMHVAETSHELRRVLDGFHNKKLVLIDTAGMSQRDVRLTSQFATLRVEGHRVQTVLALSAGADRGCLTEALAVFQPANPEALIVTKLDEAAALGGVLSLAIRAGLPIAYLCDGQRVPEDLHLAAPKRFWLMHNAVKLTQTAPVSPDENELAASFGGMELATHA